MPIDPKCYPRTWKAISRFIRFYRAAGRCEQCGARHGEPHPKTGAIVILTVHHAGVPFADGTPGDRHNKLDNRLINLVALCQSCHWTADWDIHYFNKIAAQHRRKLEAGQLELFK